MNPEKIKKITELLNEDLERAKLIYAMSAHEAAEKFTELGCEVNEAEMLELGKELTKMLEHMSANDQLDEKALDNVAGGGFYEFGCGMLTSLVVIGVVAATIPW